MTLREALIEALTEKGLRDRDTPAGQVYQDDWFRIYQGHRSIKLLRLGPMMESLALHDAHHLLLGYGTDVRGEAEIVAWELASGGCGRHLLMWLDRVLAIPLMGVAPRASLQAMRRGWHSRNLYGMKSEEALALEVTQARRRIETRP